MTDKTQPEALRLANEFKLCNEYDSIPSMNDIAKAEAELRRLHAENTTLQQGYDAARMEIDGLRDRVQELGAMLRENRSKRIVELEAQLEAIGAGGVEPLRRRECLHQIAEPAAATRHGIAAWMTPEGDRIVTEATMAGARKNGGASLSSLRNYSVALVCAASPKAEAANPGFLTEFNEINGLPAGEYPALPKLGNGIYRHPTLGDLYDTMQVHQRMVAYVDADRAMRAQAAPAAVAEQGPVVHDEELLEQMYWEFDGQRRRTGEERLAFKGKMRSYASEFRRRSDGKMTFAQSVSDDMMNLADRLGSEYDDVDPRAWKHLLVYAPKAAPAAVAGPSDDEILALNAGEIHFSESPSKYPWAGHGTQYHAGAPGVLSFARAVLARWGTPPAVAGAPVAWMGTHDKTDLYYRKPPQADVVPLYATPQPAQAQAGAVPLTDEQIRAMCKESWVFETVKQWVRITEQHHGIKGGLHG